MRDAKIRQVIIRVLGNFSTFGTPGQVGVWVCLGGGCQRSWSLGIDTQNVTQQMGENPLVFQHVLDWKIILAMIWYSCNQYGQTKLHSKCLQLANRLIFNYDLDIGKPSCNLSLHAKTRDLDLLSNLLTAMLVKKRSYTHIYIYIHIILFNHIYCIYVFPL